MDYQILDDDQLVNMRFLDIKYKSWRITAQISDTYVSIKAKTLDYGYDINCYVDTDIVSLITPNSECLFDSLDDAKTNMLKADREAREVTKVIADILKEHCDKTELVQKRGL